MSDYISREAAIAYIREQSEELQKAFEELGGESGIYADAYNDLAEDFHRIPAADLDEVNEACRMGMKALERQRWIPCSERLPVLPNGDWQQRTVIVCAKGHVFPLSYEREVVRGKAVERWKWMWNRIYDKTEAITHWMSLPEPPKEVLH